MFLKVLGEENPRQASPSDRQIKIFHPWRADWWTAVFSRDPWRWYLCLCWCLEWLYLHLDSSNLVESILYWNRLVGQLLRDMTVTSYSLHLFQLLVPLLQFLLAPTTSNTQCIELRKTFYRLSAFYFVCIPKKIHWNHVLPSRSRSFCTSFDRKMSALHQDKVSSLAAHLNALPATLLQKILKFISSNLLEVFYFFFTFSINQSFSRNEIWWTQLLFDFCYIWKKLNWKFQLQILN